MREEVVVVLSKPVSGVEGAALEGVSELDMVLAAHGAVLTPIFERPSETPSGLETLDLDRDQATAYDAELGRYFLANVDGQSAAALAATLRDLPGVETVYIKPAVENPLAPDAAVGFRPFLKKPSENSSQIPDYRARQGYLRAAPDGIDVQAAWAETGGRGAGVRIIDIEGGWCLSHYDLRANQGGLVSGAPYPDQAWRDHGTAVLGEISADDNGFGVCGIAPDAQISVASHQQMTPNGLQSSSATAIQLAAASLRAGDVLLLEMHRPGPRHNFEYRDDQAGYIAVEWWADDYLAILGAVARGVIVVEAAGNGAEDMDDGLYDTPYPYAPENWRNPFRDGADSGAIIVGAGAPAGGSFGPDRSRLDFSNYGSRVDCQGWGRGVVTTGYGDLYAGLNENFWYTDTFSGTSSASPIVTGAVACLQGIAKARGGLLGPGRARELLRSLGSAQVASAIAPVSQHIGARPDLRAMIKAL